MYCLIANKKYDNKKKQILCNYAMGLVRNPYILCTVWAMCIYINKQNDNAKSNHLLVHLCMLSQAFILFYEVLIRVFGRNFFARNCVKIPHWVACVCVVLLRHFADFFAHRKQNLFAYFLRYFRIEFLASQTWWNRNRQFEGKTFREEEVKGVR